MEQLSSETEYTIPPRRRGQAIDIKLTQKPGGALTMRVWTLPQVEEMFKNFHLQFLELRAGDFAVSKVLQGVKFYQMAVPPRGLILPKNTHINDINAPPLTNQPLTGMRMLNLGFLRAVGISEGPGVIIKVNWPIAEGEFDEWQVALRRTFPEFYQLNLVEREVSLRINIEEM